ncbi:MAG: glutaminyl-peptide cyclotransferase, partial [Acidimicrobiales bacterium]
PAVFAEGLAVGAGDRLVQLTWKDGLAYGWTADAFDPAGQFEYQGEGWGLTTLDDGTLIRSDGTDRLTEHDPSDFSVVDDWQVTRTGGSASDLNELEWDGTHLWANRWKTDEILRIDPECKRVDAVVDASDLADRANALAAATVPPTQIDVMNGVAAIPGTARYLVTGKFWPVMFEVTFEPAGSAGA